MAVFSVAGQRIELLAVEILPTAQTSKSDAWLGGEYRTVRLLAPVDGVRLHTNGRDLKDRPASHSAGAWVAIGDVIQTSNELVDTLALPGAFTHAAEVRLPEQCVVNVGVCAPILKGAGGNLQAEYIAGPKLIIKQVRGHWHGQAGHA